LQLKKVTRIADALTESFKTRARIYMQAYAEQAQIEFRPYQLMGFCTYLELSEKLAKADIANKINKIRY